MVREIRLGPLARVAGAPKALCPPGSERPSLSSSDARTAKALPDHNTLRAPHKKRVPAVDGLFFLHLDTRIPARPHLTHPVFVPTQHSHHPPNHTLFFDMPPKAAQKTPTTGGKAPAGKAPAEKKEAGKKTAAPSGDKKKRTKSRKETYSSYIYKGEFALPRLCASASHF